MEPFNTEPFDAEPFDFEVLSFEDVAEMFGGGMDTDAPLGQSGFGAEASMIPHMLGVASVSPGSAPPSDMLSLGTTSSDMADGASTPGMPSMPGMEAMTQEDISAELSDMLQRRDAKRMEDALAYQSKARTKTY